MKKSCMTLIVALVVCFFGGLAVLVVLSQLNQPAAHSPEHWHSQDWMQPDPKLPDPMPRRVLAMTDLPPLKEVPTLESLEAAIEKSAAVGCGGAVLSFSWPSLEKEPGKYTFDELKQSATLNSGRILYLGIQVLNTTVRDLPADLADKSFDDPIVIDRFKQLLDALGPLLKSRIRYLSIGNESDIYLAAHIDEVEPFKTFLQRTRDHAKSLAPSVKVSTTLTDAAVAKESMMRLIESMDAYFLTYYHGQHGIEGEFKDTATTKQSIVDLVNSLDDRAVVFQEIGFPSHVQLASPEQQAEFVAGVFDAWEQLGEKVELMNYFLMYDFPESLIQEQFGYYGIEGENASLMQFMSSLGLHTADGVPKPAWSVFQQRAPVAVAEVNQ